MAITLAYLSRCIYLFSSCATVEKFIELAWLTNHGISRDSSFPLSFPNFLITDINYSSLILIVHFQENERYLCHEKAMK